MTMAPLVPTLRASALVLLFVTAISSSGPALFALGHGDELFDAILDGGNQTVSVALLRVTRYGQEIANEHDATFLTPTDGAWLKLAESAKAVTNDSVVLEAVNSLATIASQGSNLTETRRALRDYFDQADKTTEKDILLNILKLHHIKGLLLNSSLLITEYIDGPVRNLTTFAGKDIYYFPGNDIYAFGSLPVASLPKSLIVQPGLYEDKAMAIHGVDAVLLPLKISGNETTLDIPNLEIVTPTPPAASPPPSGSPPPPKSAGAIDVHWQVLCSSAIGIFAAILL